VDHLINVTTNVGRDILQNAALFKTSKMVVWEYVSNSLQYVDRGTSPVVKVKLQRKNGSISIEDNGRGMDKRGLENFFVMHGENLDRRAGIAGRGRFGTGKSAAFGIGTTLRISTVRNNKKSVVELDRNNIDETLAGVPVPTKTLILEEECDQPNGTTIIIEGIPTKRMDKKGIIQFIERHLAHGAPDAQVWVDSHLCEYEQPPFSEEIFYETDQRSPLGLVTLKIRIAKAPLDVSMQGISISSNGVWHETSLVGLEGKEMVKYIFGEIDVPRLEQDNSDTRPFDLSRSMTLNPENELVRSLYSFIGSKIEIVRKELVERERAKKKDVEIQRLAKQGAEIASIINSDFNDFRHRLTKAKTAHSGGTDRGSYSDLVEEYGDLLIPDGNEQGVEIDEAGSPGKDSSEGGTSESNEAQSLNPILQPSLDGQDSGRRVNPRNKGKTPKGGFHIDFLHMGNEEKRAKYEREGRMIHINLDHPQISAARGIASTDDPSFMRLSYEVAFSEYSVALASELAEVGDYFEASDAIFDIRETLNRVARKAASLYKIM
jgi:hypothetical protein